MQWPDISTTTDALQHFPRAAAKGALRPFNFTGAVTNAANVLTDARSAGWCFIAGIQWSVVLLHITLHSILAAPLLVRRKP